MITFSIPCYKSNLSFLDKAVESIIRQTSDQWRLIVVDGGEQPDDRIKSLVDRYAEDRINYIYNDKDKTMAGNWNFAFQLAETEFVTLLHDDDYLEPNYVETVLNVASNFPKSAIYYSNVNLVDDSERVTYTTADLIKNIVNPVRNDYFFHIVGQEGLTSLLKGCFIFCPSICYRKLYLPEAPFTKDWRMVTDFQFYFDTLLAGHTFTGINKKLYNYRRHDNNQTVKLTASMERFEEEIKLYDVIYNKVKGTWDTAAKTAKQKRIIKLHLLFLALKSLCSLKLRQSSRVLAFYYSNFFRKWHRNKL